MPGSKNKQIIVTSCIIIQFSIFPYISYQLNFFRVKIDFHHRISIQLKRDQVSFPFRSIPHPNDMRR